MEAAKGKACLPSKAQKRHAAGRANQRNRNPMPNNEGDPTMRSEKNTDKRSHHETSYTKN